MVKISALPLDKGYIARTLVEDGTRKFEVFTYDTRQSMDSVSFEFWGAILSSHPFETVVYECVPASKPYSLIERKLAELVPIDDEIRRDLEQGDLYVSRSTTEDSAAIEHDNIIEEFKDGSIVLLTQGERAAIFGPGKLLQ